MRTFIRRYLDPSEWMAELLFGLIMTLTFTLGAGLVVKEGPEATRELLLGVLGCNLAWGVIDGILYILGAMYERGQVFRAARVLRREGVNSARTLLDELLEDGLGRALSMDTRTRVQEEALAALSRIEPHQVRLRMDDIMGAIASFTVVVLTTIPALLPFLLIEDRHAALRTSNLLLTALLFFVGYTWATYTNARPLRAGLAMTLLGLLLVQMAILLGG